LIYEQFFIGESMLTRNTSLNRSNAHWQSESYALDSAAGPCAHTV